MTKRFVLTLLLLLSIIFLPYWLYLPGIFAAVIFLPMYWEGVFLGFLVDILYGEGVSLPFISPVALAVLVALIILLPMRERLRTYVQ